MSTNPAVIVNKRGGFFTALAYGVFGLLITVVVCASGLGFYALYVADSNAGQVFQLGKDISLGVVEGLPKWMESLPPVLTDAINDRREPSYRANLDISVRVKPERDQTRAVIRVRNHGDETVSLLVARVVLLDEDGDPLRDYTEPLATPLAFDDNGWRGPILPGSERVVTVYLSSHRSGARGVDADVEITELRLWNDQPAQVARAGVDD